MSCIHEATQSRQWTEDSFIAKSLMLETGKAEVDLRCETGTVHVWVLQRSWSCKTETGLKVWAIITRPKLDRRLMCSDARGDFLTKRCEFANRKVLKKKVLVDIRCMFRVSFMSHVGGGLFSGLVTCSGVVAVRQDSSVSPIIWFG